MLINKSSPAIVRSPPIFTFPAPFGVRSKSIFVSSPEVPITTAFPVAPFVTSTSLTALEVVWNTIDSFPFASAMNPPSANLGAVNVLLVNVLVVPETYVSKPVTAT